MQPPIPGECIEVRPGLRRILAPNPGPMTYWGTNTFILGDQELALIDPGPDDPAHFAAILAAIKGQILTHILVTHAHLDHSPLALRLSKETGAPIFGFGPAEAGRSATMTELARNGLVGGGEGVDHSFSPDQMLKEGDTLSAANWSLQVLHTPGHFAGHLSFAVEDYLISGDHVMEWASSLVSPPDGDLTAFMATSERLLQSEHTVLYPAHGNAIHDPAERLSWLIKHRKTRETSIIDALSDVPQTVSEVTQNVYHDIDPKMWPAAERNVFAHLIDLSDRDLVKPLPRLALDAKFVSL